MKISQAPSEVLPSSCTKEVSTAQWAAYSLPLCEIKLTLNDFVTSMVILDQGSQITAICADIAHTCSVHINMKHRIEMEGANGDKSWTLGCADDLQVTIGNLSFMHVHIVQTESAPFHLILGCPFYSLLLCKIEDHPDGSVSITLHDPTDFTCSFTINTST